MKIVIDALNYIASLGPMVMMPIIILVIGLILRQKLSGLIRSALLVGIGFAGVNTTVNFFISSVGPAIQKMVSIWGLRTDIMDVGWPARAAATWSFPMAAIVVIVVLGINILMLTLKWTRCVMVDFWSYNHFIFTAALVWYTTKSTTLAIIGAVITAIVSFLLADWTAPLAESYFGLPGVSFPTTNSVNWAPIAWLMDKIYDKIPGFRNLKADPEFIQKKFGVLGEPMIMGLIFGILIGLLGHQPTNQVLTIGMSTAAAMVLIPKMMQILMEGLIPFADGIKDMLNKRFSGSNFTIGIDAALTVANPSAIAVGILMVPTTLILAMILPGNRLLPLPDIAYQAMWLAAWPVAFSKGNIVRGWVTTVIITCLVLLGATSMAQIHTQLAIAGGFTIPKGLSLISTEDAGTHLLSWIIWKIMSIF
ncbi:PTS galactitol transporter subunit IIC [Thermoanaerobacterium thermosaccharolyticum]|uniref:Phosphotransferase system, galactitol-specific IIC component n=1 Tax=Thermoanaerobacterium thermosaccharolyticum M0795 TaxID=698948 RepID=L0IL91_THETR|nr:PTS transporter subunit IIC [Thermoanaerobacterium thermosaccharolyticum]AGB19529.1 phosphotransferase system, galactitol-specific IIC component [Thermoanaerobacterium thermosaccharolyticum M0795]